jgi:RecG-like helicase
MKSIISALCTLALLASLSTAFAADKEVTITGEGKCGKCALKETKECQNVVQVEQDGKKMTYYLVQNDVAKKFHPEVCTETKKVKVIGTVKEVDGKQQLTASKIELVKEEKS